MFKFPRVHNNCLILCRMGDRISTFDESRVTDGISIINKHSLRMRNTGVNFQVSKMKAVATALVLSITLRVVSDFKEGLPFIGVHMNDKPCKDMCIPNDPHVILWSLTEQLIYWKGKMYCRTHIVCTLDCVVEISWSMKRQSIKLWVKSLSGEVQTDEIPVERLECEKLWPIVGAISVGKESIEFHLLNKGAQPSELHDVTQHIGFFSAGGKMSISKDGKRVSRSAKDTGNSVALLNKVISEGVHYWKLEVVSDFGASIGIGLATSNFQVTDKYRRDPLKHVYHHTGLHLWRSYRGFLYWHGKQLPQTLEPLGWQNNCPVIVELILNMDNGTLEIFKNGKSLGIAFRDIRGPVQPAVAFYAAYEKEVHLLEFRSSGIVSDDVEPDSAVRISHSQVVQFDQKSLKGRLMLSEDGMTLYRHREHSGNAYCLLNVNLTSGFYRWSFVVQNDQGASTCIGVAREPITLKNVGNLYTSQDLYVFRSFQGMLYSEGQELKKRCSEFWVNGSLVEVIFEVHSQGGQVRYAVNGEDQGVAFTNIKPPVKPIVGYYAGMEKKITLVHFEHMPLELAPTKIDFDNDINTDHTNHSAKHNPLPAFIRSSEVSMYYPTCMTCGASVDVVALPCKHAMFCVDHLVCDGSSKCLICDEIITGVWNIL